MTNAFAVCCALRGECDPWDDRQCSQPGKRADGCKHPSGNNNSTIITGLIFFYAQVGPIQREAILGEAEGLFGEGGVPGGGGGGGLHPMMEGDDNMELLECQLGEEEGEEGDESPRPVKKEKNGSDRERF